MSYNSFARVKSHKGRKTVCLFPSQNGRIFKSRLFFLALITSKTEYLVEKELKVAADRMKQASNNAFVFRDNLFGYCKTALKM